MSPADLRAEALRLIKAGDRATAIDLLAEALRIERKS